MTEISKEETTINPKIYPDQLESWMGSNSGGVRRIYDEKSGRPTNKEINTKLLVRLRKWVDDISMGSNGTPRIIILVGGPGNGKTDAVETTLVEFCKKNNVNDEELLILKNKFKGGDNLMPWKISHKLIIGNDDYNLSVIQDASIPESVKAPKELLLEELDTILEKSDNRNDLYLFCVNRGVLDDTLLEADKRSNEKVKFLLEQITLAITISPESPRCWPLANYKDFGIWPMDAESLFLEDLHQSGREILQTAIDRDMWLKFGECKAGEYCPFCYSAKKLREKKTQDSFIKMMRWGELVLNKRFTFRDIFTIYGYLLSDVHGNQNIAKKCDYAKNLKTKYDESNEIHVLLELVMLNFNHKIFKNYNADVPVKLWHKMKSFKDYENIHRFLKSLRKFFIRTKNYAYPSSIEKILTEMSCHLDPAIAESDIQIKKEKIKLKDIDIKFSRSINEGYIFIAKNGRNIFSKTEKILIERFIEIENILVDNEDIGRQKAKEKKELLMLLREFVSTIVRRILGSQLGFARGCEKILTYETILKWDNESKEPMHYVANEFAKYLNSGDYFDIQLNVSFSQPLPKSNSQAITKIPKIKVKPSTVGDFKGKPKPNVPFLDVKTNNILKSIPLTFQIFESILDLDHGMSEASMPRDVNALIDLTRSKLAGSLVQDNDPLDQEIILPGNIIITYGYDDNFILKSN